jgi:flagella basal body P-ring formation protein FlgA
LTESDTSLLPRGYIVANEHAVGHKLRRAIKTGDPITPGLLETPAVIHRGQKVRLEARSGALTVRMAGIAKSDGILGQVIEFENQSSKRSIQAIVRSPQSAEILLR